MTQQLRYLADAVWAKLPLADFRARFFVECFAEKLRLYTPQFYQARLMNIFSSCAEMLTYLVEYQSNDKNSAYVVSAMDEIIDCWDADPVAQEIMADVAGLRVAVAKSVSGGDLGSHTQARLKALCRAIVCRKSEYEAQLIRALEGEVTGPVDLTQKDRITTQIDRLTGLYTTHLLGQGYSPTYLFNRAALFTWDTKYGLRDFAGQFQRVVERLRNHQVTFDVFYGIHTTKPSLFLGIQDESDLEFLPAIPAAIQGTELEKFKKNIDINIVVKFRLTTTDYVTAALRAKDRLDTFLDAASLFELNSEFQVSAHCVTIARNPWANIRTLNVDLLLGFMAKDGTSYWANGPSIRQAFSTLDPLATDQLGRSLRYVSVARHSVSIEQKLLNLWIALESLFTSRGSTILASILECVPQLYAAAGLVRRVGYLRDLLVANEIPTTPLLQSNLLPGLTEFNTSVTDNHVYTILKNEPWAIELFNSLGAREHLKYKLMLIFKDMRDNRAILARMSRSEADVRRQLRRIYFLRNKIAHTGQFQGVRPQLVTHLTDYLFVCYRAISQAAARAAVGSQYGISELLTSARLGADTVTLRASGRDEITSLEALTIEPVV